MSAGIVNFYEFPTNTAGSAAIPILMTPTPLAFITTNVDANTAVTVRATIGWLAVNTGSLVTNVIFRIWRGAPLTGAQVISAQDSGEVRFDRNKVTSFAGVDSGFTGPQTVTYVLTGELADPGTAATVIGGLTLTSVPYDVSPPNPQLSFTELPNNSAGSVLFPVGNAPAPLAALATSVSAGDTISVRATIGWEALSEPTNILFKIWRGAPLTGTLVVSALDSGESIRDRNNVASIIGIDTGFTSAQNVVYFLTAETTDPGTQAQVIGPLTLIVSRILPSSMPTVFFALPVNTPGSVNIPITTTPQPIATLNLNVTPTSKVLINGSVGWSGTGNSITTVVFRIWRGAAVTGTLIYSVIDSADIDRNKITSFHHVDTGFTAAQNQTYVLTAEVVDPAGPAGVVGPITVTVSDPVDTEAMEPERS